MRLIATFFMLLLSSQSLISQTTVDPKVNRKSSYDTYVNKIVIDDNFTIVSMKFVSKSISEQMEEYFRNNPEEKEKLDRLDTYTRQIMLERMAMQFNQGGKSISFQPNSYLLSKDGRRFKFVKASSIPVSPEKIIAEADKRYYFKVYFEKLHPGIEIIDIIEGEQSSSGSTTYWNFYGVEVNNPGKDSEKEPVIAQLIPDEDSEISINLNGTVIDVETNKPVAAKIVCLAKDSNSKFDSVITSKSGKYEFVISPDDYLYTISAAGYQTSEESFDLSFIRSDKAFTRDFYLTPLPMSSVIPPIIVDKIAEEEIYNEEKVEENSDPIVVGENTFRLNKVYFDIGQASILPSSYNQLAGLVTLMRDNPTMKIEVIGHTDNQGNSRLNKRLSVRRAFEVRQYLIEQGIDGNRIKFQGKGDEEPISENDTEENRSKNRRVEFIILQR